MADTPRAKPSKRPSEISDFGQKLGGARKDIAKSGVKRAKADKPTGPAYERQYIAMPDRYRPNEWHLFEAPSGRGRRGGMVGRRVGGPYPSEKVANEAKPLAAVAKNHYATTNIDGTWSISRRTTKGAMNALPGTSFKTRDEAMKFMAANPQRLLETKTPKGYGENLLREVKVTYSKRVGPKVAKGDVTPNLFMQTFAPRGVEFGHWEEGNRRGKLLTASYEALHDLSRATGLKPEQLTMGGQLGISFGARGTGGMNSGSATYHPDYGTMNFTKPHGAGALAHEYLHALDHLLGRLDDPSLNQKVRNSRGDDVWKTVGDANYASNRVTGFPRERNLPAPVREAMSDLIKTMTKKTVTEVEAVDQLQRAADHAREQVKKVIEGTRRQLTESVTYRARHNKPASPEQLERFDRHAAALLRGEGGTVPFKSVALGKRPAGEIPYEHPHLRGISDVMKEVRGRTGFGDYYGSLDTVAQTVRSVQDMDKRIGEAKAGVGKAREVSTDFLKEARRLDQTRTTAYWTQRHEMFARAGEAWIHDKLTAQGQHSPYLVAGSKNSFEAAMASLSGRMGDAPPKPFPEGPERQAINAGFDRLFAAIRQTNLVPVSPNAKPSPLLDAEKPKRSRAKAAAAKTAAFLAPAAIMTAMLAGANEAKAEGRSEAAGAATEGAKAAGALAGFTLATTAATVGLVKAGVRASRAIPAVQVALMAASAAHGAITAKPGERLAGAAKGAWDASLPGAVINTARDISSAVSARRAMAAAETDSGLTYERTYTKGPKAGQTETVRKAI